MITANEARKIFDTNHKKIKYYLGKIEIEVLKIAKTQNEFICYVDGLWESKPIAHQPIYTEDQFLIKNELSKLGYDVVLVKDHEYIPPGLANDDGSGPTYVNNCLKICW